MNVDYSRLPVDQADRLIREEMDYHREQMQRLRLLRGQRLQQELDAGKSPAQVAVEIDTAAQIVYKLSREYRLHSESEADK